MTHSNSINHFKTLSLLTVIVHLIEKYENSAKKLTIMCVCGRLCTEKKTIFKIQEHTFYILRYTFY